MAGVYIKRAVQSAVIPKKLRQKANARETMSLLISRNVLENSNERKKQRPMFQEAPGRILRHACRSQKVASRKQTEGPFPTGEFQKRAADFNAT